MRPNTELGPTAVTSIVRLPSWHSVEDTMNGFFSPFSIWSDSPVSFDSSIFTLLPDRKIPSAGTVSPADTCTMSPATRSSMGMSFRSPSRITVTCMRLFSAFSTRNCLSFCRSLIADTFRQTRMAAMIAMPSYHPSSQPSVLMPRMMEIVAEIVRRIIVKSCMPIQIRYQ